MPVMAFSSRLVLCILESPSVEVTPTDFPCRQLVGCSDGYSALSVRFFGKRAVACGSASRMESMSSAWKSVLPDNLVLCDDHRYSIICLTIRVEMCH